MLGLAFRLALIIAMTRGGGTVIIGNSAVRSDTRGGGTVVIGETRGGGTVVIGETHAKPKTGN